MIITVEKQSGHWVADRPTLPGSPVVGRGDNPLEALGALLCYTSEDFGVTFTRGTAISVKNFLKKHPLHGEKS